MGIKDEGIVSHFPAGIAGFIMDDQAVEKTAAYTVVKDDDAGKTFFIRSAVTFTLPDIATGSVGQVYKFVNLSPDGTAALTLSPNANDGIAWKSVATADTDLINTKATALKGDYIVISNNAASADAWQVEDIRGTWAHA